MSIVKLLTIILVTIALIVIGIVLYMVSRCHVPIINFIAGALYGLLTMSSVYMVVLGSKL